MSNSPKVHIIYPNFYNFQQKEFTIGGVQTYIYYLCTILYNKKLKPVVYQKSFKDFDTEVDNIQIKGFVTKNDAKKELYKEVLRNFNNHEDILIFGTENFSVKTTISRSILIQHGIYWDLPYHLLQLNRAFSFFPQDVQRFLLHKKLVRNFYNTTHQVCVDYNYLNWLRTSKNVMANENIVVIPNFSLTDKTFLKENVISKQKDDKLIKILFARRFVELRGVHLMVKVSEQILNKYSNVQFTFAGEGPLLKEVQRMKSKRVSICKYEQKKALAIHQEHHIAIIPSLGSEGTSISVAEAMASGCAVIASNIGGISNMIISGFNGILTNPNNEDLFIELERLILDRKLRTKLALNGHKVFNDAFNVDKWTTEWENLIEKVKK